MSDEELLQHKKIGPEVAARYLQDGTTAQDIRVEAQFGVSPYCVAEKMTGRYRYRVNVGLLMKFKHGDLGLVRKEIYNK
jgi:hypothetical protein